MEKDSGTGGNAPPPHEKSVERRAMLAHQYDTLPTYGSPAFWSLLETADEHVPAPPLEVLVKILRAEALARGDQQAQRRIFTVIIARLQSTNEMWVNYALSGLQVHREERRALAADLYADLCEHLLRAFIDVEQHFWEESFFHALRFARKHLYESFLRREGHWRKITPGPGLRVPHKLVESLERAEWRVNLTGAWELPDERAEQALRTVEQADALLHLPAGLRAIVWLVFWEDCSIAKVGELLNISERTARNRLRAALARLRHFIGEEQEEINGASA